VREPPDCAPCMLRDCPIDHRCMTAITPDQMLQRARALLSDKPEPACQHTPLSDAINRLKFAGQLE
jgi:heptosyltransferase-2